MRNIILFGREIIGGEVRDPSEGQILVSDEKAAELIEHKRAKAAESKPSPTAAKPKHKATSKKRGPTKAKLESAEAQAIEPSPPTTAETSSSDKSAIEDPQIG